MNLTLIPQLRWHLVSRKGFDIIQSNVEKLWENEAFNRTSYEVFAHGPTIYRAILTGKPYPEEDGAEPLLHGVWKSNCNVLIDDNPDICNPISGGWPLRGFLCKVYKVNDS